MRNNVRWVRLGNPRLLLRCFRVVVIPVLVVVAVWSALYVSPCLYFLFVNIYIYIYIYIYTEYIYINCGWCWVLYPVLLLVTLVVVWSTSLCQMCRGRCLACLPPSGLRCTLDSRLTSTAPVVTLVSCVVEPPVR